MSISIEVDTVAYIRAITCILIVETFSVNSFHYREDFSSICAELNISNNCYNAIASVAPETPHKSSLLQYIFNLSMVLNSIIMALFRGDLFICIGC